MASYTLENIFSKSDILFINQLPEVLEAKAKLDDNSSSSGKISFSISLTDSIRTTLSTRFGLDLSNVDTIPMRWIKGDTLPHIDVGKSNFENTYLVYLNSNPGKLLVDNVEYPISENTGYVFNEGVFHETINTGFDDRLMLGPMSEKAFAVGAVFTAYYYPTQADALVGAGGYFGYFQGSPPGPFVVGTVNVGTNGSITNWRIASNSTGSSSQVFVYANGSTLAFDGDYYLYPSVPCFLEGTQILCQVDDKETYLPIEQMKTGTLVKTSMNGFKKVDSIGKGEIQNLGSDEHTQNRLYKCSPDNYPEVEKDLFITGCHSILVNSITDNQREDTIKALGKIFVTDNKYRLMACLDDRAVPWNSEGVYTIWHFALENDNYYSNYGVYANGLLVETCSKRFMNKLSNLTLIK